jgi:hypothetical protein
MTPGITDGQRSALRVIAADLEQGTYLAGGVAVATVLHHRLSLDLDLFVPHDFDPERLEERLAATGANLRVVGRARGTLHLEVEEVPVSILSYRYPLLAKLDARAGVPLPVASLEDLACMKISAIAGRGAAKDFWDLHELLEHGVGGGSLAQVLELYSKKYAIEDIGHAVRSLAYFAEADAEPLPLGLVPDHWAVIKSEIADAVRAL